MSAQPRIACALCVGSAPEAFLAATLASIADVVDTLVVNDNSGARRSANVAVLESSAFAAGGRLRIGAHPFVDFAGMRNDAQAMLVALDPPPEWVLFIDADEVHGSQIRSIARGVLPRLGPDVAQLDGYTYHFWGTFRWISDVARRMAFYRFSPTLRWENAVHEKLRGTRGRDVVVPYVYHHYGNVLPPRLLAEKHQRYYRLGNPVPRPPDPHEATLATYLERSREIRPYCGAHPAAARDTIAAIERESRDAFATLDAGFRARRTAPAILRSSLQGLVEDLRVRARYVEHPGLYRAPMVAQ